MNRMTITPAPVRAEIRVKATPARAFEVFTARMGSWWDPSHSINSSPQKDVVVEPRAGGRWFERGEDGSECDWGKVLVWEPPARAVFAWQINGDWNYDPNFVTELELNFVPDGAGFTLVSLEHRNLENFGDKAEAMRGSFDSPHGWRGGLERFRQVIETPG